MSFRIATAAAALFFAWSASLQANDPDPLRWLAIYGGAALLSTLAALPGALPLARPALALSVVAAGWAASIAPGVIAAGAGTGTEVEREIAGLVLVGVWMLGLRWRDRRRR